jgi:hypothetical protein
MTEPAILVPSGLARVHPQLETSIKSIAGAIRSLQASPAGRAATGAPASLVSEVAALQAQLAALQAQVNALGGGAGYTAAQGLPAYCAVYESAAGVVALADCSSLGSCAPLVGVTRGVTATGQQVPLARNGDELAAPVWNWTPRQPVYLGRAGALTQLAPPAGYPMVVGWAIAPQALRVGVSGAGGDGPHTCVFQQQSAATSWSISHGLNRYPAVTILDSSGNEVEADVNYLSPASIRIDFAYPLSGQAFLN